MVLQRTIDNLRERPKHERQAVAFWISIAVVVVLMLAWGVFFFRNISAPDLTPVNDAYSQAIQQAQDIQTPAPEGNTGWVSSASQDASSGSADGIQIIQEGGAVDSIESTQ